MDTATVYRLEHAALDDLIERLQANGYTVVGPTVREGAIVYDHLRSSEDLPRGWTDRQDAGRYRLERRDDEALFGYVVGPHSWKRFLQPPRRRLWRAVRGNDAGEAGFAIEEEPADRTRYAFLGARSCELHALAIQDRVYVEGPHVDSRYASLRRDAFVIAVQCGQAASTCFCVSMKTGPRSESGFDLALTEVIDSEPFCFVLEVGSPRGMDIVAGLSLSPATSEELDAASARVDRAREQRRAIDREGLRELFPDTHDHPRWAEVAERCLACANCTMVCPTCFCSTVEDTTDLSGEHAERWQRWDSCFTMDFTRLHGGSVRATTSSRYRQWLTHKLSTWIDQFGTSGCVGCGRCVTWCPVGIDITEEVRALRAPIGKR